MESGLTMPPDNLCWAHFEVAVYTKVEVGAGHSMWVEVAPEGIEDIPVACSLAVGILVEDSLLRSQTKRVPNSGPRSTA